PDTPGAGTPPPLQEAFCYLVLQSPIKFGSNYGGPSFPARSYARVRSLSLQSADRKERGEREDNMPSRRSYRARICNAIHDSTVILIQLRVLAAELVFTVAAIYGLFHAFILLTR